MDENRPPYRMQAPASPSSAPAMRLPGRSEPPRVDDRLVQPEVTRDEIVGGRKMEVSPAERPHAVLHSRIGYVVGAKVAPGYETASDLLTRHDEESDFASDTAVLREGIDPETGARYLEEIAFEVVSEQTSGNVTEKPHRMTRRGVRRIFAVFLKRRQVGEWSRSEGRWEILGPKTLIEDRCLIEPIEVESLLDAASADDAVVSALAAKNNPEITKIRAGDKASALLSVLEARGLSVSDELRRRILATTDLTVLDGWVSRAAVAESIDQVLADDDRS